MRPPVMAAAAKYEPDGLQQLHIHSHVNFQHQ